MFPLMASGRLGGARRAGQGARRDRQGQPRQVRRQPAAHAVGRHEAARRDRARHGDGARHPADGRAVRRARRAHAAQDAGRAAAAVGRHAVHRAVRHALDPRGDQDRQPDPAAVAASRAGQGRARTACRAARWRPAPTARRRSSARSIRCCSPTRSKRRRCPMAELGPATRPERYPRPVDAASFGIVEKPLSGWERLGNVAAVRKLALLVAAGADLGSLRALAQQSAAVPDVRGDDRRVRRRRSRAACCRAGR